MHMPKSNVFAYVCCMALGVVFIVLAVRGRFTDPRLFCKRTTRE